MTLKSPAPWLLYSLQCPHGVVSLTLTLILALILTLVFLIVVVAVVMRSRKVEQEKYLLRRTLHL